MRTLDVRKRTHLTSMSQNSTVALMPDNSTDTPLYDAARHAQLRTRFLDPEQSGREEGPRDTVTEVPFTRGMSTLLSWDQDGVAGPAMLMETAYITDADSAYLLERCRAIYRLTHPDRVLRII